MKYSQIIKWTNFDKSTCQIEIMGDENDSVFDVRKTAMEFAIKSGWIFPKWYEFWRWNDTRISLDELLFGNYE